MKKDLSKLTPLQYKVTQEDATEPPFDNEYYLHDAKGLYVDITDGTPLFTSMDKFHSSCGWPSFAKPIEETKVIEKEDLSLNRIRTEVRSKEADSHLGHVFTDGPEELGGLRYCINSAAIRFIPFEELKEQGYEEYIKLFD